ncbi:hypothetical protein V3C99_009247 [Haemonchus contortus]|uniref:Geranylgeranyl transferase type-2 subunit alpha n=1 Tax=Haemonchus contortus TaxID=6289 RepID=A0A7I4YJ23_HAECO
MHFVKKVPTSDEEKAVKQKERAAKLKVFCTVRDRIFDKRAKGELDDEILSLTQRLLEKNPDIYTFWNIRRETIEKKIKEWKDCESTTEDDSCKEKCRKKIENILSGELFLTQACLEENPKSYAVWFHRGWTLQRQEHPDIKRELALCEKALKLDCRNFHTWDHRRVVAKLGNLGEEEELEFSNRLIAQNFSNYSAWHYRAVLLPRIQNAKTGEFKLDDTVIASELKKVTSAFFTDPDDQSAWVYSRWLLEMGSEKEFLRPDSASPAVPLTVSFHGNNTTIVMSKACTFNELLPFVESSSEASWRGISAFSEQPHSARIWQCMSDVPCSVRLNIDEGNVLDFSKKPYVNKELLRKAFDMTIRKPNVAIETITENCKQLMEMEPKNMWAHYMYTLCLMETRPAECHEEILKHLGTLATMLDVKRQEIYKNLASRQILNRVLRDEVDGQPLLELLMDGKNNQLAIRNAQISSLDGVELLAGLVTQLDVSGNELSSLDGILLPNLEYLSANENPITRISATTTLCNLKFLSLGACMLDKVECVLPALKRMCSLERFLYCETPLVEKTKELQEELESVRLIPYYM